VTPDTLTLRQLNRATLARQFLLERATMPAIDTIRHLVGLQAQEPPDPFIGLWSRLTGFTTAELDQLLLDRAVVRLTVQRGTMHAVTADDCLLLRPLAQPVLTQQLHSHQDFRGAFDEMDLDAVMAHARELLAESPRSTKQLRVLLGERFPAHDAAAMAFACRNQLPFIQVPPRGLWARPGEVVGTTPESWLGRSLSDAPSVDEVMVRYLAAFGPATLADAAAWSGLQVAELRPAADTLQLRRFGDEAGRTLLDLPRGPLPPADTPVPPRLLPRFDNAILSHADRTRIIADEHRRVVIRAAEVNAVFLVDGFAAGRWRIGRKGLELDPFGPLSRKDMKALEDEAARIQIR
jgi:hypothetical protein